MPEHPRSIWRRLLDRVSGRVDAQALARSLRQVAAAQQQQSAMLQARLAALAELVSQRSTSKDATELFHAMRALTAAVEDGLGAGARPEGERPSTTRLFRALDDIAKHGRTIIVGPWTGEIGFELLYWIPFVEWFRTRWRVPAERLVLVSRGGVESWYGMPGARYVDILSLVSPSVFRERADRDKQRNVSAFDLELCGAIANRGSLAEPANLHPQLMYRALAPFWKDEAGFGLIARFTHHRPIAPPDDPVLRDLPEDYVAVRFYHSNCFPDKPKSRSVAHAVVSALAERSPVVVLNPGVRVDDHADILPEAGGRVVMLPSGPADRNLAVQTAVIGRARAMVGTYGGFAYVAPFCGVPSVGFYAEPSFKAHHLYVAQRVLEQLGRASVTAVSADDAALVHMATSGSARRASNTSARDTGAAEQRRQDLTA